VTGVDTFTFKANNGAVDSNVATVNVTIAAPNHPPVAVSSGSSAPTAVRFDAITDELVRTTNLPAVTGFTLMGWFRIAGDGHSYSTMLGLGQPTSSNAYLVMMCCGNGWRQLMLWSGSGYALGSNLALNTWYHVAMTVSGTGAGQVSAYLNGKLDFSIGGNAAVTGDRLSIGNDSHSEWLDGSAADVKIYNAVLTPAEIAQEMTSYAPVRTAGLNSWYPLQSASDAPTDYSGNSYTMRVAGTLTDDPGGPSALTTGLTTAEDTALSGTLQASDADGDPLTYGVVAQPQHGTLT